MVPVIVMGLQSVHGYGHNHRHRHMGGRDEHPPQPPPPQQSQRWQQDAAQDNDLPQQDDVPGEATDTPRPCERRWSSRAADALCGLWPVHGAGPTCREGSGSGSTEGTTCGNDAGTIPPPSSFTLLAVSIPTDFIPLFTWLMLNCLCLGYYPPNCQLVVGTDPIDSFEELAELLGQVKPSPPPRLTS